MFPLPWFFIIL